MSRLLLVSSSRVHGTGYLDHCEGAVRETFAGVDRILFVPYALFDRDGYSATARERFERMGIGVDSIHDADDPRTAVQQAQGVFIGGGNTFRLLRSLWEEALIDPIRNRVGQGMPYMGTSAGSNVAGPTIRTTNDMPIVFPPSFEALRLVEFQINPHYIDADPGSTHMGETRDTRLTEYLEENSTPVVAIREGTMISVDGTRMTLQGQAGGRLFRPGEPIADLAEGARIDSLL